MMYLCNGMYLALVAVRIVIVAAIVIILGPQAFGIAPTDAGPSQLQVLRLGQRALLTVFLVIIAAKVDLDGCNLAVWILFAVLFQLGVQLRL